MDRNITLGDLTSLCDRYFPSLDQTPFASADEEYASYMRFADMLCTAHMALKGSEEAYRRIGTEPGEDLTLAFLPHPEAEKAGPNKSFGRVFEILLNKGAARSAEGKLLPLDRLIIGYALTPLEVAAVILSFLPMLNRKYEKAYAGFDGSAEVRNPSPTIGTVFDLCRLFLPLTYGDLTVLYDPTAFACRYLFEDIPAGEGCSDLDRHLTLRRRVINELLGIKDPLGDIAPYAEYFDGAAEAEPVIAHRDELEDAILMLANLVRENRRGILQVTGPRGSGKTFFVREIGALAGISILNVDCRMLYPLDFSSRRKVLDELLCASQLDTVFICLDHFDSCPESMEVMAQEMLSYLKKDIPLLFLTTEAAQMRGISQDGFWKTFVFDLPSAHGQKDFWSFFADKYGITMADDVSLDVIASKYNLMPGVIESVLLKLAVSSEEDRQPVTDAEITHAVREYSQNDFGSKAQKLDPFFTWDDLQLSPSAKSELERACTYITHRSVVYETYGFEKKLPYGRGISILLYGPPGTGKTMTARVLANKLGLDIYRIDLSQLESKYIGESEKNIADLFAKARYANCILFFDEADSLFAKRTAVSSSNDRHSNAETSFLLQKIEDYNGISVLATNNRQSFDQAFTRRITFTIPIDMPDAAMRRDIWEDAFPVKELLTPGIDFDRIAERLELSGSSIKSAALAAAYDAAAENRRITQSDIIKAIDRENRKNGHLTSVMAELM